MVAQLSFGATHLKKERKDLWEVPVGVARPPGEELWTHLELGKATRLELGTKCEPM